MPPNIKEEKVPITEYAAPFKDEPRGSGISKPTLIQNGNPSAFLSLHQDESQTNTNPTVRTTHQYSYELDKYTKNIMLIFHYDNAYDGSRGTADKVKSTFEKFRFEVEMHHNISGDGVKTISAAFFQRDFSEYGAIGIVVIGKTDRRGEFTTSGDKFRDRDILSHMSTANILNKPKIIIFECDQIPLRHLPKAFVHTDIIDYNFPALVRSPDMPLRFFNPLSFTCDIVDKLGDKARLDDIFYCICEQSVTRKWKWPPSYENGVLLRDLRPLFSRMYVNLSKSLNLWRNP